MKQITVLFAILLVLSACREVNYSERYNPDEPLEIDPAECALVDNHLDENITVTLYGYNSSAYAANMVYRFDVWGMEQVVVSKRHIDKCDSLDVYFQPDKVTARLYPAKVAGASNSADCLDFYYNKQDEAYVFSITSELKKRAH